MFSPLQEAELRVSGFRQNTRVISWKVVSELKPGCHAKGPP